MSDRQQKKILSWNGQNYKRDMLVAQINATKKPKLYSTADQKRNKGLLFFCIAYHNLSRAEDLAFIRTAMTYEKELKKSTRFDKTKDRFLFKVVKTTVEFIVAWGEIAKESKKLPVLEGQYFGHASNPGDEITGLEFSDGTLTIQQIKYLSLIKWSEKQNATLILTGCNTAVKNNKSGFMVAEVFSNVQKIRTKGEQGFAYFSYSPTQFFPIAENVNDKKDIYLNSFERGANAPFEDPGLPKGIGAKALPDIYFEPKKKQMKNK